MLDRALLIHLESGEGMDAELEAFLNAAQVKAQQESGTAAWYAFRSGPGAYGIFDAFADDTEGESHRRPGPIVQALMMQANALLSRQPRMQRINVLASKLPRAGADPAPFKGMLLCFPARAGHERELEQFLRDVQKLVMREPKTAAWFAIRMDDGKYGIFDVFPDNGARLSHLVGKIPRALAKHALPLLGGMPDMRLLDVLAHKPAH